MIIPSLAILVYHRILVTVNVYVMAFATSHVTKWGWLSIPTSQATNLTPLITPYCRVQNYHYNPELSALVATTSGPSLLASRRKSTRCTILREMTATNLLVRISAVNGKWRLPGFFVNRFSYSGRVHFPLSNIRELSALLPDRGRYYSLHIVGRPMGFSWVSRARLSLGNPQTASHS